VEFVKRMLPRDLSFEGLRVVVDCAKGAAFKVAPETLWELGAEVNSVGVGPGVRIQHQPGGRFPAPGALRRMVLSFGPTSELRSREARIAFSSSMKKVA
jgi:phosphoglucosamine mutase